MSEETGLLVNDAQPAQRKFRKPEGRALGLTALVAVILLFSAGSTLVKLAETPGVAVAFWRMILCSFIWSGILRATEGRWLSWTDVRPALIPGIAFGLNITFFFTGVTKTTVASAEFTGALTPLLVVPLGAWLFHERLRIGDLAFGLISLIGLAIVLFFAPANGEFSWGGVSPGSPVPSVSGRRTCSPVVGCARDARWLRSWPQSRRSQRWSLFRSGCSCSPAA